MKKEFKVGDRVRLIGLYEHLIGELGTVVGIDGGYSVSVEFDKNIGAHDCNGRSKLGHGLYITPNSLELVETKKEVIVIYRENNKITALNKATGEKATARCHPNDKFDFLTGAKVAFDRLVPPAKQKEEPKKLYNGKVVCVESWTVAFTVGKIYEFKDGYLIDDEGDKFPWWGFPPVHTLSELTDRGFKSRFIEVVE